MIASIARHCPNKIRNKILENFIIASKSFSKKGADTTLAELWEEIGRL